MANLGDTPQCVCACVCPYIAVLSVCVRARKLAEKKRRVLGGHGQREGQPRVLARGRDQGAVSDADARGKQ